MSIFCNFSDGREINSAKLWGALASLSLKMANALIPKVIAIPSAMAMYLFLIIFNPNVLDVAVCAHSNIVPVMNDPSTSTHLAQKDDSS